MIKGLDLAQNIATLLKSHLPHCNLTAEDNFNDSIWHSRIIGAFCAAGVNAGLLLEVGRKINDWNFLKAYSTRYRKEKLGEWELTPNSSTEIDLIYLGPKTEVELGLCEYENHSGTELYHVRDNIIKFYTFSKWKRPSPVQHLSVKHNL